MALYDWAAAQAGLVLIAGHAHEPVFKSQSHEAQIKARLVRWPNEAGDPLPHTLAEAELRAVLAAC